MSGVLDIRFPDPVQEAAFHAWERRRHLRAGLARHGAASLNDMLLDWDVLLGRRITPDTINASVAELLVVSKILQAMGGAGSDADIGSIHAVIKAFDAVMLAGDDAARAREVTKAQPPMSGVLTRLNRVARRAVA